MPTLFATATAVEDNVLDTMKMAEDAVIRTARTFAEAFEPITKRLAEVQVGGLWPAPADIVDHTFGFVDRLEANLQEFSEKFVEVLSVKGEAGPSGTVKPTPRAKAA